MPSERPSARTCSFHSLIHEKRCSRLPAGWRMEVATVVDCRRSSAALPSPCLLVGIGFCESADTNKNDGISLGCDGTSRDSVGQRKTRYAGERAGF